MTAPADDKHSDTAPVIRAQDVRFHYGADAFQLRVHDFTLQPGQHTAVIGPSGCGKTTLLRLLTGVLTPNAGRIRALNNDLTTLSAPQRRAFRIRHIGMIFQDFALLESLTARDNILLPYRLGGVLPLTSEAHDRADQLARSLGIAELLGRKPARLSRGERQRVAIARALITRPALLVCDEPTAALDPDRSLSILDLLLAQAKESGATVLAVTHDHALLDRFAEVHTLDALAQPATQTAHAGAQP